MDLTMDLTIKEKVIYYMSIYPNRQITNEVVFDFNLTTKKIGKKTNIDDKIIKLTLNQYNFKTYEEFIEIIEQFNIAIITMSDINNIIKEYTINKNNTELEIVYSVRLFGLLTQNYNLFLEQKIV